MATTIIAQKKLNFSFQKLEVYIINGSTIMSHRCWGKYCPTNYTKVASHVVTICKKHWEKASNKSSQTQKVFSIYVNFSHSFRTFWPIISVSKEWIWSWREREKGIHLSDLMEFSQLIHDGKTTDWTRVMSNILKRNKNCILHVKILNFSMWIDSKIK